MLPDSPFSEGEIEDSPTTPQPGLPELQEDDHMMEDTLFSYTLKTRPLRGSRYSALAESSDPIQQPVVHPERQENTPIPAPRKRGRFNNNNNSDNEDVHDNSSSTPTSSTTEAENV